VTASAGISPRWAAVLGGLVVLYLAAHLSTIATSRLPWFDDTFFSSIADTLVHRGEFTLTAGPLWFDKPVYLYGPVYFLVVGAIFREFGVGVTQTRLPGLLCGFGIVLLAYGILRRARVRSTLAMVTCAAMALDPTFHQNIHSGRMDSMAIFFILLAFYCLMLGREDDGRGPLGWIAASGAFAALGVLTTPRPGYLLIPMGVLLLARWAYRRDLRSALSAVVWGTVCLVLVGAWIVYAFGSIPGMLAYYADFSQDYTSGGFGGIRTLHAPLLVPLLLLLAAAVVRRPRILANDILFFAVLGIVEFYVVVKDKGTFGGLYSFFIIPLAYLALGYLLSRLRDVIPDARRARQVRYAVFALLFLFNGAIFAARSTLEVLQWEARSPAATDAIVRALIPPGSRVVGDDKFYFAVRKAGSDFQYLQRGGTPAERARYHAQDYDFQYLVTAERDTSELLAAYSKETPLVQVATISAPPDGALARMITTVAQWAGIGSSLTANYEGRVFARMPEPTSTP
jgi:4-amino-4-deoxy-L-arabinose transferase-like glycosyltransferase